MYMLIQLKVGSANYSRLNSTQMVCPVVLQENVESKKTHREKCMRKSGGSFFIDGTRSHGFTVADFEIIRMYQRNRK